MYYKMLQQIEPNILSQGITMLKVSIDIKSCHTQSLWIKLSPEAGAVTSSR